MTDKLQCAQTSLQAAIQKSNAELKQLSDTNDDIQKQLADARQTICDNQQSCTEIRSENQCLVTDKNALVAEIDLLKNEYNSIDSQTNALKRQLADATVKCEELTQVIGQKSTELAATSNQLSQVNKMHIEAVGKAELNAHENAKLQAAMAEVENAKFLMQMDLEALRTANADLEQTKLKQIDEISEITTHNSAQAEQFKCQQQLLRSEIENVERLQVELATVAKTVLAFKEKSVRSTSEIIGLRKEIERLMDTIEAINDQKAVLQQEVDSMPTLRHQLLESQRRCTELTTVKQNQDQTYQTQLESIAEQRSELECRAKLLSHNLVVVTTELDQLKEDHIHVNKLNAQLTAELDSLSVDHKQATESAADNCRTIKLKCDTAIADLNAERDAWDKCRAALERKLFDAKEENDRLTDASSKLNLKVVQLDAECANLSGEVETARQESQTSKKIAEDLQIKWKRLEVEIRENQQKSAQLEAEVKQLTVNNEREQQATQSSLKQKYEALCQTEKDLSKAVAILQAKLIKHRENSVQQEKEWKLEREKIMTENNERVKEVRIEMEGKLEKMKAKMVSNRCVIN